MPFPLPGDKVAGDTKPRTDRLPEILRRLIRDEAGWIGTIEFVLMTTLLALGLIVGLATYRNALLQEYGDLSGALLHLDQSFSINGEGYTDSVPGYASLPGGGIDVTVPPAAESW